MDAIHQLVSFGAPAAAAIPHLLGLTLAALLLGVLGVRSFRFS